MATVEWSIVRETMNGKRMQILLCDDDKLFLDQFQQEVSMLLEKLNVSAEIVAVESVEALQEGLLRNCDMAFLDIDFADSVCNGVTIAKRLRAVNRKALLFFVTNYIDYAPVGYEVGAFRYILKRDREEVLSRYMMQAMEQLAEAREVLRLKSKDDVTDIPLDEITYLEVLDHNVSIHAGGAVYELVATLSSLEQELECHGFLRVHKSFLVNMAHIRKFRSRECLLEDGTVLAVGERNYTIQKQKYLLWKGLA